MTTPTVLEPTAIDDLLRRLPGWRHEPDRGGLLRRRFVFADFNQAFAFMTQVALRAEKMNHHPEWSNVYRQVDVVLTTHDASGVTALDAEMAAFMDAAFARLGAPDEEAAS